MEMTQQPIVIWCGSAPNQRALAVKISRMANVVGIVIDEKKRTSKKRSWRRLVSMAWDRFRFRAIYDGWKQLQKYYDDKFRDWPAVPILRVNDINSPETANFTKSLSPALIVVSGTGLVRQELIGLPVSLGIINLHTGLSPYVKGGPNCTNWCIANNDWHLVGNTIMWINAGIDTGRIISSETIDIRQAATLYEAQRMVMEHAHDLYGRVISYLTGSMPPFNSVDQADISEGKLYLTKMWSSRERVQLLRNWKRRSKCPLKASPREISLPE